MYNIKEIIDTVICGDTLTTLRNMPDECVDTIITSPPYWGLRDYGDETKTIWGGDKNCEHKFDIIADTLRKATPGDLPSKNSMIAKNRTNAENRPGKPSQFCSLCGAWYGQLGLEPSLDLFLEHLLEIFIELKRVLKPTGVFFLNWGDCYEDKSLCLQNYRGVLRMLDNLQKWELRNDLTSEERKYVIGELVDKGVLL